MKVVVTKNYEEASDRMFEEMKEFLKPGKVIGLATGSSPLGLYERMVKDHVENGTSYKEIKSFNLDEYVGLPITHPESYYAFMHTNLFDKIDILEENAHVPSSLGEDLEGQAAQYEEMIRENPIDIQVLGLGSDGHIAFNEPGTSFDSLTHVTDLLEQTIKDNSRFFDYDMNKVPHQAVTQGIATIMRAKKIILIATGENKAEAMKAMVEGPIVESCPASILQKHDNVVVVCDEAAAKLLKR